ncbi:hypothetical protein F511_19345 [Dorcoceras hygrometricum]|uniref:N-acetyltransferase domain-containing protein n=1 Tax=Dorcoceras hygrometricum TaxID=472368 RepID=A0A2Z7CIT8_9LAMI|nr:hypothetical protein F511_19345 [Dorcoceras hygrometricum]
MELKSNLLPEFKVQQPESTSLISSKKRDSTPVLGMFTRETFPTQYYRWKHLEVHCNNDQNIRNLGLSKNETSRLPELSFDRLQLTDQECSGLLRRNFGRFVARGAILDEEYWTAAWLRAEAHWESLSYMRHVDSYKRKYAEQASLYRLEFYALKRRCFGQEGKSLNCFCLVADQTLAALPKAIAGDYLMIKHGSFCICSSYIEAQNYRECLFTMQVKKEEKTVRRTVLNSIVGTLDLSIRQFVHGETYPEDIKRYSAVLANQEPLGMHKYAYIANVCVAKFARRQGIASNMIYLATDVAIVSGLKQLFVHVNADNRPAQDLYRKTGFKQVVEAALSPISRDQRILMSMDL